MSDFPVFRGAAARVVLAAGAVLLATGGIMAGLAPASSAAPAPARKPPPIDHQLCYLAAATGFKIPAGVVLRNQIDPKGFRPKISSVAIHCNPVQKSFLKGPTFRIINPRAHLVCFRIAAARQRLHLVAVTNQFGIADLNIRQPNLLCLPSWKSLTGPPAETRPQPPGLSHFTCYPVTVQQGGYHVPPGLLVRDQFARHPVPVHVSNVPTEMCEPTQKTIGRHVTRIINLARHLLCFPAGTTPIRPKVFDQNQFGSGVVHIRHTSWLCLPSQQVLIR